MGLEFPVRLVQNDTWSAISDTENAFVFSAYRLDGNITVVGVSLTLTKLYCQYWHVSRLNVSIQFDVKQAEVRLLPGRHTQRLVLK